MKDKTSLLPIFISLTILLAVAISACSQENKTLAKVVLKPSDTNYPKVNKFPAQTVQFTAIVPNGFPLDFNLRYVVASKQDERNNKIFISPSGCKWTDKNQFFVNQALALKQQSYNTYTGSFAIDYFQEGVCGWHLEVMDSSIVRGSIFYNGHSAHLSYHPFADVDLEKQTIHIWCTKKSRGEKQLEVPSKLNERVNCVPFSMISSFVDIPSGFHESIPNKEKEWDIHVTQYLRSLTVEFHDLDKLLLSYKLSQSPS